MKENHTALRRYILVTPVKNEERSLPDLIQSVANQTIMPALWVIVDDGSTDQTSNIIKESKEKYDWIKSVSLKESPRDLGKHISQVYREGFDFSINYCKVHEIKYEYIGIADADIILSTDFFDRLIEKFEKNSKLGLASGGIYYNYNNELILEKGREDLPRGGARMFRRKCFEDVGGYSITYAPDSIANIKAKLRGWEIKQFEEIKATQTRRTSTAEGFWKGYWIKGATSYFVNISPCFAMLKSLKYLFNRPYYIGLAYFWGYFSSFLRKQERIDDAEIREYYHKTKLQEVRRYYFDQLKSKIKRK